MDFQTAWNIVRAELDPKPWTYTDTSGATLTIIPAGFRAARDEAEVIIRTANDIEEWVYTPDVQHIINALHAGESWKDISYGWGIDITATDGNVTVTVWQKGVTASVSLPPEQRLPLASALARALDVARAWED